MLLNFVSTRRRLERLESRCLLAVNIVSSEVAIDVGAQVLSGPLFTDGATLSELSIDGAVPLGSAAVEAIAEPDRTWGTATASINATAPPSEGSLTAFGGNATFKTQQQMWSDPGPFDTFSSANARWIYTFEAPGPVQLTFSYTVHRDFFSTLDDFRGFSAVIRAAGGENDFEWFVGTPEVEPGSVSGFLSGTLQQSQFFNPGFYTISVVMGGFMGMSNTRPDAIGHQQFASEELELSWTITPLPRVPDLTVSELRYDPSFNSLSFRRTAVDFVGDYSVSLYRSSDSTFEPMTDILVESKTYKATEGPFGASSFGGFSVSPEEHRAAGLPFYLVVVDPENSIEETNEDNNVTSLFQPIAKVYSVSFSGDGFTAITPDPLPVGTSNVISGKAFESVHWLDRNLDGKNDLSARVVPISFVAESSYVIDATIDLGESSAGDQPPVQAIGEDGQAIAAPLKAEIDQHGRAAVKFEASNLGERRRHCTSTLHHASQTEPRNRLSFRHRYFQPCCPG